MRVVVVDALSSKAEERKQYAVFERAVRDAIELVDTGGVQMEYITTKELGKFIYKSSDPRSGTAGPKTFDRLDMIFVAASPNLLPWESEDLYTFIRMCYTTKKCLFGTGAIAHFLAFCSATNGIEIHPVNGSCGSRLDKMRAKIMAGKVRAESRDVFLDAENGDLYQFDKHRQTWVPYTSIGFRRKAMQLEAVEKFIAKAVPETEDLYLSKSNEVVCRVTSRSVNHWIFHGICNREFKVRNKPTWALDFNSNQRSGHPYHVLAESRRAPLVIKSSNLVCLHFDVSPEYPESIIMLQNFVKSRVSRMQHHGYVDQGSHLYVAFYSQSEAAAQSVDLVAAKIRQGQLKDGTKHQKPGNHIARKSGNPLLDVPTHPKFANPHECIFLRNSETEPSIVRSNKNRERLRTELRPTSSYTPKSNFALQASKTSPTTKARRGRRSNASVFGQEKRIEAARKQRTASIRFPTSSERPRSAPMHFLRSVTDQELVQAAHKHIPPTPLLEKFDPKELAAQAVKLHHRHLTPTHNLRTFSASAEESDGEQLCSKTLMSWLKKHSDNMLVNRDPSILGQHDAEHGGKKTTTKVNKNKNTRKTKESRSRRGSKDAFHANKCFAAFM